MAGIFEVFVDGESLFRFRLKSPDGTVIAVSTPFEDKTAVVAGIAAARECAGMGLVTDLCPATGVRQPAATVLAKPVPHNAASQGCDEPRKAANGFRTHAKELGRASAAPRWTGAA
ncbi:YegP family protein [Arthrobacter bambusae]|uniref:YegP family protein n=1 Tax=Arthrobacter bambusae TaxID=1338426 RepID=UPI001F511C48|nr:YegP family protein [Arthrobacter bambusae]MCI0141824.1 YegP family protein [Arthrobacter bambusae]